MNDSVLIAVLVLGFCAFVAVAWWECYHYHLRLRAQLEEIDLLKRELAARVPPQSCLADASRLWVEPAEDERLVLVKFRTLAGLRDFYRWAHGEILDANIRARAEAEKHA
jgi:hypothetical protein